MTGQVSALARAMRLVAEAAGVHSSDVGVEDEDGPAGMSHWSVTAFEGSPSVAGYRACFRLSGSMPTGCDSFDIHHASVSIGDITAGQDLTDKVDAVSVFAWARSVCAARLDELALEEMTKRGERLAAALDALPGVPRGESLGPAMHRLAKR